MTGFFRDGVSTLNVWHGANLTSCYKYCNTSPSDFGSHTVAAQVSKEWLDFSASRGNDLRGILSGGCKWCLCVSRWKESLDAFRRGEIARTAVPKVQLNATHEKALSKVTIEDLQEFAVNRSQAVGESDPSQGGPIR